MLKVFTKYLICCFSVNLLQFCQYYHVVIIDYFCCVWW